MRERDALYLKLESYDIRKRTTDNSRHTRILTKIIDFDNDDLGVYWLWKEDKVIRQRETEMAITNTA